jgi:hypothetical protein
VRPAFPLVGRADGVASLSAAAAPAVPADGFLAAAHWSVVAAGVSPDPDAVDPAPSVCIATHDTPATRALWPYPFAAAYTVSLMATDDLTSADLGDEEAAEARAREAEVEGGGAADADADADAEAAAPPARARPTLGLASSMGEPTGAAAAAAAPDAPRGAAALVLPHGVSFGPDQDPEGVTAGLAVAPAPLRPPPAVQLRCVLQVANTGADSMTFTAGVLADVRLPAPRLAAARGAAGRVRFDVASPGAPPSAGVEGGDAVPLDGVRSLDRLYVGVAEGGGGGGARGGAADPSDPPTPPASLTLRTGDMRHELEILPRAGFRDVGVRARAPRGGARAAATALAGEVARAVTLPPGSVFTGEAVFRLHDATGAATPAATAAAAFAASRPGLSAAGPPPDGRDADAMDEHPGAVDAALEGRDGRGPGGFRRFG